MKRLSLAILIYLLLTTQSFAVRPITVEEQDGIPSVDRVWKIKVTNGTLTDDGEGVISITIGAGTPGGLDTQIQFNDAGSFGGDAGFIYNKTTDTATLGSLILTTPLSDANVANNITLDDLTQVTNRSHTALSNIGTNTHAQIDTHIAGTGTSVHGDSYLLNTGDTATGNYTFDTSTLFVDAVNDRVGIGTIEPIVKFHISSHTALLEADGSTAYWTARNYANTAVWMPALSFMRARGSKSSPSGVLTGDFLGGFLVRGYNSSGDWDGNPTGTFTFSASQNHTATAQGTDFTVRLVPNNSTTIATRFVVKNNGDAGIGTPEPNSRLQVAGPISTALVTKTAAYTVTADDSVVLGDATTAAFTITLPTAVNIAGRHYTFKKIDSSVNTVIIDGNTTETIDGAATYSLGTQWKYVSIVSNGANWLVVANN